MSLLESASVVILLFVLRAECQIPVKKSITDTQTIFYIPSIVRADMDVHTNIILNFLEGATSFTPNICDDKSKLPVYMRSRAFYFPCVKDWQQPDTVSFVDIAPEVSLTQAQIIIGDRRLATFSPIFAEAKCRILQECKFGLEGDEYFTILPQEGAHVIREMPGAPSMLLKSLTGQQVNIPLNEYNSFEYDDTKLKKKQVAAIALTRTNWIVSANKTHYILTNPELTKYEDSARIFSMILILIGFVIFLPSSTDITKTLLLQQSTNRDVAKILTSPESNSSKKNYMWIVLIDFTSTALMVTLFQVSNVDFKSTFSVDPFYEHSDIMDGFFVAGAILSAATVIWFSGWMHLRLTVFPKLTKPDGFIQRIQMWLKKNTNNGSSWGLSSLIPDTISSGDIVLLRIAYEYALAVGFLASAPTTMGIGFSKAIYLVLAGTLMYAIGRDSALLCWFNQNSLVAISAIILISWAFSAPLVYYGIAPVTHDSSSFPTTEAFDFSVSLCIAMSLYAVGFISTCSSLIKH